MPSGKTHDIITAVTTPIIGIVAYTNTTIVNMMYLTISYLFASLMFNGDLDIKSRPYRRWLFLKWIWIPYRKVFPHRSIWTHGIIIGTVIRIIYLMIFYIGIWNIFNLNLNYNTINWYYVIIILIGLELGNTIHTISDKCIKN